MAMLPAYQINADPFANSLNALGQGVDQYFKAAKEREQKNALLAGLARTPGIGLAQAESLAADPALARNVLMQYSDPMLGVRRNQAEAELSMVPLKRQQMQNEIDMNPLRRQQIQHGMTQQDRMYDLQSGQIRNQSPEGKAAYAAQAGIQRGTPEWNQFVYGISPQQPKTMEVNGKVVSIPAGGGAARVLYDGGPNFDKLPEFSAKAAGFTSRMVEAESNLRRSTEDKLKFDPTSAWTAAANAVPEGIGNYTVRSEQHQQYKQSAEQWIRSFLRKESGAAIGKDEFARDFKVYFPQPGDTENVVRQKEQARLDAMRSFQMETRGFFDHTSPQHAARLKEWQQGAVQPASKQRVKVSTPDEARRLPKGTPIILPDGTEGVVP